MIRKKTVKALGREDRYSISTNQNACDADVPQHTTALEKLMGLTTSKYVYKPTICTKFLWLDFIFY